MATSTQNAQTLLEKIQSLPADQVAEVEHFVEVLRQRAAKRQKPGNKPLDFPVDDLGAWPEDLSLRREELYGDEGR